MEHADLLRYVVGVLERLKVPYFVTGSTALIYFGEPRFTNDIDIVLRLIPGRIRDLCSEFPDDEFYVSEDAARDSVRTGGQFNIIHPGSGLKIDLMTPLENEFDQMRFARRIRLHPAEDYEASFASPEDVILRKMEYYEEGGSEKHVRDITGVLKTSHSRIDYDYIDDWAARKGLTNTWNMIRRAAGK